MILSNGLKAVAIQFDLTIFITLPEYPPKVFARSTRSARSNFAVLHIITMT